MVVNEDLKNKLKQLPSEPGVYFHKDASGEVIYVGKAAVLKNRVRWYFNSQKNIDVKTRALIEEIVDTDWIETETETDALFLEGEMVKRYMPRYNILLRDDRSQMYVRIDMKSTFPVVSFTRHPLDDDSEYYGPFYNGYALKKAMRYLRKVYPYYTRPPKPGVADLDVHIGLSPSDMSSIEYKASLRKLISYIKGNRKALMSEIEAEMKRAAKEHDFERATILRDKLRHLMELKRRIMFGDREFIDISKDRALNDLYELLGLPDIPARIEGYDISHMSGSNVVASMVVFSNGASDRGEYRKFKTRQEVNDDFQNMNETIGRRFSPRNIKAWRKPDLVLIDGGKGQLVAAIKARDEAGYSDVPFIGLAKKMEQIVVAVPGSNVALSSVKLAKLEGLRTATKDFLVIDLPESSHIIRLLQRIRDESHRFAVSYHTTLKRKSTTLNQLEEIPGVGVATRRKLMRQFGSFLQIKNASESDLAKVVGVARAGTIFQHLNPKSE